MFVPVQLDKMRNLRYGMKAISLIEKKFGKSISKIDMDDMTMEEIATFIWAGLVHEDKELTPDKVMEIVDNFSTVQAVMEKVSEAMNLAFGGTVEKK
ncbi:hypothetical protein [Caloramator proteoclasticus]|uniref:Phage tail assembly chaperone protein, TAC n=1 Tax=Caloramator proteoclasticus DSM 10124 TaxID=1121262 RepID=A0A1M4ZE24_9CLOT|nr:hypothetical protein [Caloramator proteoclasticus]SHF16270.1 hypothetical protein SAMN02746091_01894 [Caloramator proteoclasticus DSM 10124]